MTVARGATLTILLVLGLASMAPAVQIEFQTLLPGYYIPTDRGVVVDEAGNSYMIGSGHDNGSLLDVIVVKLDATGAEVWTNHIVTAGHSSPRDFVLDAAGDVIVVGWTDAQDFPTVGGLGDPWTGFRHAFVMKLDQNDGSIIFSTVLGGDYTAEGHAVALTDDGEIWLAGSTGSTDFFTTPDAYQAGPSAPLYIYEDGFLTKLTPNADAILYSSYFGGFQDDRIEEIELTASGDVVLMGETNADDFPLLDPIQTTPEDIFVSRLSADGSTLQFSTYLGGSDFDYLNNATLDDAGYVYLVGGTRSPDFPVTAGSYQDTFVGEINGCGSIPFGGLYNCDDGFLLKLATDGTGLVYGTFLATTSVDRSGAVAVDASGNAYVTGVMGASVVLSMVSADGSTLESTLSLPTGTDGGHGVALGAAGEVYFTGQANVPSVLYVAKVSGMLPASPTGVETPASASHRFALRQNSPNPFRAGTTIDFELPQASRVALRIYDARGALVRTVADAAMPAGPHSLAWNGRGDSGKPVAAGVYFARLTTAEGLRQTRKMAVLH